MSCEETQSALIDYHYGELSPELRGEVSAHLPSCGPCAQAYCQLQVTLSELDDELLESPAPRVESALAERLGRSFRKVWWRRLLDGLRHPIPLYQWAMMTTLLLLVFALVSGVLSVPLGGSTAEPTLRDVDTSRIVRADPHTL